MLEDFENLMFPLWVQEPEEGSFTEMQEEEDPTQGEDIRTPWGGLVD